MARIIFGKVTNQNGTPMQGLRVQAWDDDWPDANDFMGEAITDGNGDYSINYEGGHWDPGIHQITTWRPDIFVAVQARTASGEWAHLAKSRTYENHKLRDDLRIDMGVTYYPVEKKMTSFVPSQHSFKFQNSFTLQPSIFGLDLGSWDMGFCGGMSAGAIYRFNTGQSVPNDTVPPSQGTPLFDELLNRQIRSMPPSVIETIYDWQSAPDEGHWNRKHSVGFRTKGQWPKLKEALDAGRPTQIVLIRVEGYSANISKNHQVVAIGYEWNPTTKDLTIFDYDPNDPGTINTLTMNFGLPNSRLNAKDSTGKRLRGFFVNTAGPSAAA